MSVRDFNHHDDSNKNAHQARTRSAGKAVDVGSSPVRRMRIMHIVPAKKKKIHQAREGHDLLERRHDSSVKNDSIIGQHSLNNAKRKHRLLALPTTVALVLFLVWLTVVPTPPLLVLVHGMSVLSSSSSSSSSSPAGAGAGAALFVGLDLGTSGARISVIDASFTEVFSNSILWSQQQQHSSSYDDPQAWMKAVTTLIQTASSTIPSLSTQSTALCVSGTSASCLLIDGKTFQVLQKPCMYDYHVVTSNVHHPADGIQALQWLQSSHVPSHHTATSPTSALAKLLSWHSQQSLPCTARLIHQADYVALQLRRDPKKCGKALGSSTTTIASDWHNCLKLGYDVEHLQWPEWMQQLFESIQLSLSVLPCHVVSPGVPCGTMSPEMAQRLGLHPNTVLVGGTTDSNAAWVAASASGASGTTTTTTTTILNLTPGTAVTSLGSTLALKRVCTAPVEHADLGVYSHAVPSPLSRSSLSASSSSSSKEQRLWLVGGASNVGCAILRTEGFDTNDELQQLSSQIDPTTDSPYNYYPLVKPGERFPIADSSKRPILEPKPLQCSSSEEEDEQQQQQQHNKAGRIEYLKGLLQGVAQVEAMGYSTLDALGATPPLTKVYTSGGGSQNEIWTVMRQRILSQTLKRQVMVTRAMHSEASYGAAILAASTFVGSSTVAAAPSSPS